MNKKNVVKILSKEVNIPKNRVERLLDSLQILIPALTMKAETSKAITGSRKCMPVIFIAKSPAKTAKEE